MTVKRSAVWVLVRMAGAFVVGALLTAFAFRTLGGAVVFGAGAVRATGVLVLLAVPTGALAALHAATSSSGRHLLWGLAVSVAASTLLVVSAFAWHRAGGTFGREHKLWWAAGGVAFLLCAAAGTRPTKWPAALAVAVLMAIGVWTLVPEGA